jgi:hypothetical protein
MPRLPDVPGGPRLSDLLRSGQMPIAEYATHFVRQAREMLAEMDELNVLSARRGLPGFTRQERLDLVQAIDRVVARFGDAEVIRMPGAGDG